MSALRTEQLEVSHFVKMQKNLCFNSINYVLFNIPVITEMNAGVHFSDLCAFGQSMKFVQKHCTSCSL